MTINNHIHLEGFAGRKPNLYMTGDGKKIVKLNVFTVDFKGLSQDEHSQCHQCVFIGNHAERAERLIEKGTYFTLNGFLRYRKKQINDYQTINTAEILVESFSLPPKEMPSVHLKKTLREILKEQNITDESQLEILK